MVINGKDWNPYYVAYARVHGESDPARMLQRDSSPGGRPRMVEFMIWIQAQWITWERENARKPHSPKGPEEHAAFEAWLWQSVGSE